MSQNADSVLAQALWRARGHLALRLAMPFIRGRWNQAQHDTENVDYQPYSYHQDWWAGQQMVLLHLRDDLRRGRVHELVDLTQSDDSDYDSYDWDEGYELPGATSGDAA